MSMCKNGESASPITHWKSHSNKAHNFGNSSNIIAMVIKSIYQILTSQFIAKGVLSLYVYTVLSSNNKSCAFASRFPKKVWCLKNKEPTYFSQFVGNYFLDQIIYNITTKNCTKL